MRVETARTIVAIDMDMAAVTTVMVETAVMILALETVTNEYLQIFIVLCFPKSTKFDIKQ